jgi:uncharacterized protein with HEPN domain
MQRDDAYLLDIILYARRAIAHVTGLSLEEFRGSRLHQDAVVHALSVIGEAARCISGEFKAAHHDIPWREIVGMRHRLIHEYFRVNLQIAWDTVHEDLPVLVKKIERLVPEQEMEES